MDVSLQKRCDWAEGSEEMARYHDEEWGLPSHNDQYLFEMLLLEGAQAGLSWSVVLSKRENYRKALDNFDPHKIIRYRQAKLDALMQNPGIVRNKLKIQSVVTNANAFFDVTDEFGSFSAYLWDWVGGKPIANKPKATSEIAARTDLSDLISKDLKKRGFKFVGTTITYAYMQAVGLVNDHLTTCAFRQGPKHGGK